MNKILKKDFFDATRLKNVWNRCIIFNNCNLATVMWHDKPWKILPLGLDYEIACNRDYKPLAEFRTQQDLWEYLKSNSK